MRGRKEEAQYVEINGFSEHNRSGDWRRMLEETEMNYRGNVLMRKVFHINNHGAQCEYM